MQKFSHAVSGGRDAVGSDAGLAARAAWLYYTGGLTQGEVAQRLGIASTKAHRLISRATRDGLVKIIIDAPVRECLLLENELAKLYCLEHCQVAPDLGEPDLPMEALGQAGAGYLRRVLESGEHGCIGIGHGRTLAAAVEKLPSLRARSAVVSLLGGLTRTFAANPFDVIHRLAERTGAEAYLVPLPLYCNRPADRDVLMEQAGLAPILSLWRRASPCVVGIGEVGDGAHLRTIGMVTEEETSELLAAGAVGEVLGHHLDASGAPVCSALTGRVMSMPVADLRERNMIAIAGGARKLEAIRAVLASGLLKGLITDEATARRLVDTVAD